MIPIQLLIYLFLQCSLFSLPPLSHLISTITIPSVRSPTISLISPRYTFYPPSRELIVALQWYPEVMHFCPEVPQILVGTKLDARNDQAIVEKLRSQGQKPVSGDQVAFSTSAILPAYNPIITFHDSQISHHNH